MNRLANKVAIVTGAGSGIGKATVELFRKEGATVVGADLHGADFECDAGDEEQVEALVAHTVRDHGGVDVMFANAGISGGFASIFEQDADDWAEILRVNLIGPFLAIKYAAPAMKERGGGSIIATASVAGLRSGAGGPDRAGRSGHPLLPLHAGLHRRPRLHAEATRPPLLRPRRRRHDCRPGGGRFRRCRGGGRGAGRADHGRALDRGPHRAHRITVG